MSDNTSSYQSQIDEINEYLGRKMNDGSRYEFERVLQHDPFLEEAIEGIATVKPSEFERDIHSLGFASRGKKIDLKPLLWIFPIIVVAGLIFLFTQIDIKIPKIQLPSFKKEQTNIALPDSLTSDEDFFETDTISFGDSKEINADSLVEPATIVKPIVMPEKTQVAPKNAMTEKKPVDSIIPKATIEESRIEEVEDQKPEPEVFINTSDNNKDIKEEDFAEQLALPTTMKKSAPVPSVGEKAYESYLDSNAAYPNDVEKKTKETVRLKFIVTANGEIKNFELLRGPKETEFTNEAIRVVKNGPRWVPAIKDGKYVDGEVVVKVNFKP